MAKKQDANKCVVCGCRIVLASACVYSFEVEPDQEPYESGVIEKVIVHNVEKETVEISFSMSCHVCPACGWVRDLEIKPQE